jgi:hypothetical protein
VIILSLYAINRKYQRLQTNVKSFFSMRSFIAHFQVGAADALLSVATGIHAAIACSAGSVTTVTTAITKPSVPKNVTATAGGTVTDIKAVQVTIIGTNYADEVITEVLPVFTVDTAGTVIGNKAFKTITSISIPAMDGAGATVSIGFGEKLGLPFLLAHNTVLNAYLGNAKEGTAPAVTVSPTAIESNTIKLNSALNGTVVDAYLMV